MLERGMTTADGLSMVEGVGVMISRLFSALMYEGIVSCEFHVLDFLISQEDGLLFMRDSSRARSQSCSRYRMPTSGPVKPFNQSRPRIGTGSGQGLGLEDGLVLGQASRGL